MSWLFGVGVFAFAFVWCCILVRFAMVVLSTLRFWLRFSLSELSVAMVSSDGSMAATLLRRSAVVVGAGAAGGTEADTATDTGAEADGAEEAGTTESRSSAAASGDRLESGVRPATPSFVPLIASLLCVGMGDVELAAGSVEDG